MTDPGLPPPFMEYCYPNLKPNSSLAVVISSGSHCPPGYRFYKLVRTAKEAIVTYKRTTMNETPARWGQGNG